MTIMTLYTVTLKVSNSLLKWPISQSYVVSRDVQLLVVNRIEQSLVV